MDYSLYEILLSSFNNTWFFILILLQLHLLTLPIRLTLSLLYIPDKIKWFHCSWSSPMRGGGEVSLVHPNRLSFLSLQLGHVDKGRRWAWVIWWGTTRDEIANIIGELLASSILSAFWCSTQPHLETSQVSAYRTNISSFKAWSICNVITCTPTKSSFEKNMRLRCSTGSKVLIINFLREFLEWFTRS